MRLHHNRSFGRWLAVLGASLLLSACGAGDTATTSSTGPLDDTETTVSSSDAPAEAVQTSTTTVETTTTPVETTTTTDAPTTTTPAMGSLEEPLAVGEPVQIGDWRIRVSGVVPDANEAVAAENQFNDPPEEGRQFFIAQLEATYTGTTSSNFWVDISLKAVGPSNVAYESFDAYCGVIPDSIDDTGETFPGGSITGNTCWAVDAVDAEALVMIAEPGFSLSDDRAFLSLDPTAEPVVASTGDDTGQSTRLDDAVPVGESAEVGPWTLTVVDVVPDATDAVMAENQFNEAPGEGEQFYMASVEATYNGDESSTFWVDMSLKSVGDSSVAYEGFDGSCGVIPDNLDNAGETFPGGTISGNVCWKVLGADVGSLVMIAEESWDFDGERVFFSLSPADRP